MSNKKNSVLLAVTAILVASVVLLTSCVDGWARWTPPPPDYTTCKVGDIILKDGTICKPADYVRGSNAATRNADTIPDSPYFFRHSLRILPNLKPTK